MRNIFFSIVPAHEAIYTFDKAENLYKKYYNMKSTYPSVKIESCEEDKIPYYVEEVTKILCDTYKNNYRPAMFTYDEFKNTSYVTEMFSKEYKSKSEMIADHIKQDLDEIFDTKRIVKEL